MTKTYVDGRLDEKTRGELIRFLAETRDARAGRAWIKALASEDDAEWGALGIGGAVYQEGAPALGEAFAKLEAGTPKGSRAAENLHDAMLTLKNPTWTTMLLERLDHPMQKPDAASDSAKIAYQNELFWQTTSAELVGELHDPAATKTLLKVIMDPAKSDVAPAALLGIVNIGKQAVPFLIDVLDGKNPELTALAKSKAVDNGGNAKTHLAAAALALGEIGRADARDALVRASKTVDHDANRASLALALTELARSADAEKAFQAAYEKLSPGATTAFSSAAARPRLLDAAARFYDPALVPWLLKQVSAAKGPDADDVRAAGLRIRALAHENGPDAGGATSRRQARHRSVEGGFSHELAARRKLRHGARLLRGEAPRRRERRRQRESSLDARRLRRREDRPRHRRAPGSDSHRRRTPRGARGARSLRAVRRQRRGGRPRSANEEWASFGRAPSRAPRRAATSREMRNNPGCP